ncbi:MAG: PDZ domain-containing protein [Acidimicrobiales bacterium]
MAVALMVLALVGAACGGGDSSDAIAGGDTSSTTVGDDGTTTAAADTDFQISDVEASVVQIQGQGTFVDSGGAAAFNVGFTGTGFVISEDGLVVTNNHVVQGAATLAVSFSDGDPMNARILGVSECSDLAVIDLDGDGYTPLEFRDDEVTVGIEVFSAGFPASDEIDFDNLDYTLTNGIVGSVNASGETSWASVDGVLQHDARILGGNSGGPLVDEFGDVVGVNYAGNDQFDTNFAIAAQDARPVLDQLIAGQDVDSLGINGTAQLFDNGLSGIFIASVESGSPADDAGIEPGDVLITLENLVLATDGTMSDYCDVLRTQGADATMDIEVYRPSLDLVLTGQVNGEAIEVPLITQTVIEEGGESMGDTSGDVGSGEAPYTYVTATDDSGLISVSIPASWSDVDGSANPDFGPSIWASPDLQGYLDSWEVPGIIVESAPDRPASDIDLLLQERNFSEVCEDLGAEPYDDGLYVGTLQIYGSCGGTETYYIILAAAPVDADYLVRVEVQAPSQRDLEAADQALNTFIANI